jgi:putative restriction endonuclease
MSPLSLDLAVRLAAFRFLAEKTRVHGSALPWDVLLRGFDFDGHRVPLVSPQGIFKPQIMDLPLSITTAAPSGRRDRPYDDGFDDDGFIHYRYRGTDPQHRDNVGLREAMLRRTPLVYLHGLVVGLYEVIWPVVVVGDDLGTLSFTVSPEDQHHVQSVLDAGDELSADPEGALRRRYAARQVHQRLHQGAFRARVLHAYREQCAICRLNLTDLLDAAHIVGDREEMGEPHIPNGLSLCKLPHRTARAPVSRRAPDWRPPPPHPGLHGFPEGELAAALVKRSRGAAQQGGPAALLRRRHHTQVAGPSMLRQTAEAP